MADISKIKLPNGDVNDIKDATARQQIATKQDIIDQDTSLTTNTIHATDDVTLDMGLTVKQSIDCDGSITSYGRIDTDSYIRASGYIEGNNLWANGSFYANKPDIDVSKNNNGLSSDVNTGLYLRGANDENIAKIGYGYRTNGDGYVELYAYNKSNTYNKLLLNVDKSGNNTVSVTSASAWRDALNIIKPQITLSGTLSAVSVPNNSATTLTNFTLQPGKYIVMCWARFNPHADTGYRYIFLTDSSTGTGPIELMAEKQIGANNTNISLSLDINFALTVASATKYYFRAWHNGGASISTTPRYHIVQID